GGGAAGAGGTANGNQPGLQIDPSRAMGGFKVLNANLFGNDVERPGRGHSERSGSLHPLSVPDSDRLVPPERHARRGSRGDTSPRSWKSRSGMVFVGNLGSGNLGPEFVSGSWLGSAVGSVRGAWVSAFWFRRPGYDLRGAVPTSRNQEHILTS